MPENAKKAKCDRPTDRRTDRPTDRPTDTVTYRSRARDKNTDANLPALASVGRGRPTRPRPGLADLGIDDDVAVIAGPVVVELRDDAVGDSEPAPGARLRRPVLETAGAGKLAGKRAQTQSAILLQRQLHHLLPLILHHRDVSHFFRE